MIRPAGVTGVAFGEASDGDPRGDDAIRTEISSRLRIPSAWAWVRQVHGCAVSEPVAAGIGAEADALITTDPELAVAVSVADCLPVALVAEGAVGIAHAGWRGASGGVVAATAAALAQRGHPAHTAVIGPGIGPCCFEVGPDVGARFPANQTRTTWGTSSVDLAAAVAAQLDGMDVRMVGSCTHHDEGFHSFRRNGTPSRQFGVAWIPAV